MKEILIKSIAGCRDSARNWLEIADKVQPQDPAMAKFCLDCAIQNHKTAEDLEALCGQ